MKKLPRNLSLLKINKKIDIFHYNNVGISKQKTPIRSNYKQSFLQPYDLAENPSSVTPMINKSKAVFENPSESYKEVPKVKDSSSLEIANPGIKQTGADQERKLNYSPNLNNGDSNSTKSLITYNRLDDVNKTIQSNNLPQLVPKNSINIKYDMGDPLQRRK